MIARVQYESDNTGIPVVLNDVAEPVVAQGPGIRLAPFSLGSGAREETGKLETGT